MQKEHDFLENLKRVWILERELLFWSFFLCAVSYIFFKLGMPVEFNLKLVVKSLVPLSSALWWYPTSYALFLLFYPFLVTGLKNLGKRLHAVLSFFLLTIWGFFGLLPKFDLDLSQASVFVMMYWFILITYYKWYMRPFRTGTCWGMIGAGALINFVYWLAANLMMPVLPSSLQTFIFDHWKLPSMLIGFGLFLLFERMHFQCSAVNWLAKSAFCIYLISMYPTINDLLWSHLFIIRRFYDEMFIPMSLLIVIAVCLACLLFDVLRRALFAVTINRNTGHWFDLLYGFCSDKYQIIKPKLLCLMNRL